MLQKLRKNKWDVHVPLLLKGLTHEDDQDKKKPFGLSRVFDNYNSESGLLPP